MQRVFTKLLSIVLVFVFCHASLATANGPIRILSIDGGGVRGVIPAVVLEKIEKELKKPIYQVFDFVAGTSTGGLIALALTAPNHEGKPIRTTTDLVDFYMEKSPQIFTSSWTHWIKNMGGLLGPKYESDGLERILTENLGDTKLSEALIPTLITGYHMEGQTGVEFFSEDARIYSQDKDVLMREIGMATAAAPTYFDPVDVHFSWGELPSVIDGALYKYNPTLLAYINAKQMFPDRKIEVYSLGTGKITAEDLSFELKGRGLLQWLSPIIRHLHINGSDSDHAVLHRMLNEDGEENYFRLNPFVDQAHSGMDDTSTQTLTYLHERGIEATETPIFKAMLQRLHN